MELVEVFDVQDHTDELIVKVFARYDMHLSAKAISRTILNLFEEEVSIKAISRHMSHLPCDATDTTVKKYYLKVRSKSY